MAGQGFTLHREKVPKRTGSVVRVARAFAPDGGMMV